MGLRTTTLQQHTSPDAWRGRVDALVATAETLIRGRRFTEVAGPFAEAAGWEDVHRRYQVRRRLAECSLAAGAELDLDGWTALYAVVAGCLLEALEEEPREPLLLNFAGVLLYELAEPAAAEALFAAAGRLDPELEHVRANRKAARARRKGSTRLVAGGRALAERARRIAAAARPVPGLTVSLCMIVKDEEEMLPGCLEAARQAVDEIVVVDTGSSDRTREIAESFGATVVDFPWNGSFADARNASLESASGDWILYLDADEHLVSEDAPAMRALLARTWREAFYLVETNYTGGDESGSAVTHLAMRLFRNRPEYRFEGRIHEQKAHAMPTYLPERFEPSTVRLHHYGYLKSRIGAKDKSRRNIELLEAEAREAPSAFNAFNLGSEYVALGDGDKARAHLEPAWDELRRGDGWTGVPYAPMLASRLAAVQRECGNPAAARETIAAGLAAFPGFTDLLLQEALCARDEGDEEEAARLAEACLELGDAPAKYCAVVGSGTYLALCLLAELRQTQGDEAAAEALYRCSLAEHPRYVGPVLPLATLLFRRGAPPDEVAAGVPADGPAAMLLLATACYESGHATAAEAWFRGVLERQPANGAARIGLVEALLSQRRYADAAREAAAEPEDSPVRAAAAAAQLFAHAAAGDVDALAKALDAAAVPRHECELYAAWRAALAGEPHEQLSAAAAAAAAVCLEALLRVQDVDAFAGLLPLYDAAAVPARERREHLAQMYLRRGFLASAAEEWLAVAQEQPDAPALVGLSQVALAQGMTDDALEFARAALELEPGSGVARRLHAGLLART